MPAEFSVDKVLEKSGEVGSMHAFICRCQIRPKVLDQRRLESRGVDKHFGGATLGNDKGIL
jgi:hypothetical protein